MENQESMWYAPSGDTPQASPPVLVPPAKPKKKMPAWGIALILGIWGGRFILHRGAERVLGRIMFAVLAVALASAWASTLSVPEGWPHSFGYGGLFGDTVVGALMGIVPGSDGFSLRVVSALAFFGVIAALLFVTGFNRAELVPIRFALMQGSVLLYSMLMQVMGKGAKERRVLLPCREPGGRALTVTPPGRLAIGELMGLDTV